MKSQPLSPVAEPQRGRVMTLALLLLTIAAGLATRATDISWPSFVTAHFGDAMWTVAVYLGLCFVFPRARPLVLGAAALAVSVSVELSQLIEVGWLDNLRKTTPGRLLLGSGFLWIDLLRYAAGATAATLLDTVFLFLALRRRRRRRDR